MSKTKLLVKGPKAKIPVLFEVRSFLSSFNYSMLYMTKVWSSSLQVAARNLPDGLNFTFPTEFLSYLLIVRVEFNSPSFF